MSSTIQNLQFLEAQLGQYLHSHEDDGTTLWVTPQGMRMPYKKTRENLEQNMKFVEVQLEKYLHEHETDTTTSEEVANVVLDPEVDLSTNWINPGDILDPSEEEYYYFDSGNRTVSISTLNPNIGSKHWRVTTTGLTAFSVHPFDPAVSEFPNKPLVAAVSPGDTVTASVYIASNTTRNVQYEVNFFNSGKFLIEDNPATLGALSSSYQKFTTAEYVVPANAAFVGINWWFGTINATGERFDLDTFAVNAITEVESELTLFTTPAGFRFPYGWTNDGYLNHNMKFLELEISKYLHKHEVGT